MPTHIQRDLSALAARVSAVRRSCSRPGAETELLAIAAELRGLSLRLVNREQVVAILSNIVSERSGGFVPAATVRELRDALKSSSREDAMPQAGESPALSGAGGFEPAPVEAWEPLTGESPELPPGFDCGGGRHWWALIPAEKAPTAGPRPCSGDCRYGKHERQVT